MPVTAINALPTPTDESQNLPPVHFQALAAALDTRLVPRFSTLTARDNAIPTPINGMLVWVDSPGSYYERTAGVWTPRARVVYNPTAIDDLAVPAGARLVQVRTSQRVLISNTAGGFAAPYGFSFTKVMAVGLAAGDNEGGLAYVTPIVANHTLTTANGVARRADSSAVPNGTTIRVEVDAVGYIL